MAFTNIYAIRFDRDISYLKHKDLKTIGPDNVIFEYIGATKNFASRMYNRIRNIINNPRPNRRFGVKNALLEVFNLIGLDINKIRASKSHIDLWGLTNDIITILKDFGIMIEVIEYQNRYESAFQREKHYIDTRKTIINGLNQVKGGGGMGKVMSLPLYDIAMMISLGANQKTIANYLKSNYKIFKDGAKVKNIRNQVTKVIKYVWGSFYDAQDQLLRPMVRELAIAGYSLQDIYINLKSWGAQVQSSWFNAFFKHNDIGSFDWRGIKNIAEDERAQYFGIPVKTYIEQVISGDTWVHIASDLDVSLNSIRSGLESIFGFKSSSLKFEDARKYGSFQNYVRAIFRRAYAVKLLREGKTLESVYRIVFEENFISTITPHLNFNEFYQEIFPEISQDRLIDEFTGPFESMSDTAWDLLNEIPILVTQQFFTDKAFITGLLHRED